MKRVGRGDAKDGQDKPVNNNGTLIKNVPVATHTSRTQYLIKHKLCCNYSIIIISVKN